METPNIKGRRILVVDDNPDSLGVVAGFLKSAGYNVTAAPSGSIALEKAARFNPVAILLEVKMPGMDGFEVCLELKNDATTSVIPVIFLTALDDIESIHKGFQVGGTDFLSKPVNKDELLARVSIHLENSLYKNELKEAVRSRTEELEESKQSFVAEINRLKETEKKIYQSKERLELALMAADEGIWDWNLGGKIVVHDHYFTMAGYEPNEFTVTYREWAKRVHPKDIEPTMAVIEQYLAGKSKTLDMEFRFLRKDGDYMWIRSKGKIVTRNKEGNPVRIIGTHSDITDRKRVEEELKNYRQHLEELVEARTRELGAAQEKLLKRERLAVLGQLTATVSHELRNPLGVIRSSAFYLQRRLCNSDKKILKHLMHIDSQVNTCDAIVSDLLEYTRNLPPEKTKEEITLWLQRCLDDYCEMTNVKINQHLASDLPTVSIDQKKMRRVVLNLITNANQAVAERKQQAEKKGHAYQACINVKSWRKNDHVIIQIEDNGIGMDGQTRDRAFDPLFTTKAKGSGLGLAIVKKVIDQHEGAVSLESKPQEGTKIQIVLPLSEKK